MRDLSAMLDSAIDELLLAAWRSMDTAPKDGTEILGYSSDVGIMFWDCGGWWWTHCNWQPSEIEPVAWMPLPPPPPWDEPEQNKDKT